MRVSDLTHHMHGNMVMDVKSKGMLTFPFSNQMRAWLRDKTRQSKIRFEGRILVLATDRPIFADSVDTTTSRFWNWCDRWWGARQTFATTSTPSAILS